MKKRKRMAARVCSAALAAAMVLGTSFAVFAAEDGGIPDTIPGGFTTGATEGAKENEHAYPEMTDRSDIPVIERTQRVDLDWIPTPITSAKEGNTGKIAVKGIEEGMTVEAYQFISAKYEGTDGVFSGWYDMLNKGFFKADGTFDDDKLSRAMMAELAQELDGSSCETLKWTEAEKAYMGDVAPGSYVIIVKGEGTKTYGPMIVSLAYAYDKEGLINGLKGAKLGLFANMAYAKMQDEPTIEKEISWVYSYDDMGKGSYDSIESDNKVGATATAANGNVIDFDIIVNSIPEYHGDHIVFDVVDEMSKGLKFGWADGDDWVGAEGHEIENFEFYVGYGEGLTFNTERDNRKGVEDRLKELTFDTGKEPEISVIGNSSEGTKIIIDFDEIYEDVLQNYAGWHLFIRYSATIDATSDMYDYETVDNVMNATNKATINFTHNSTVDGEDDFNETPDRNVYTFKVELAKVDSDGVTVLPGAKFKLESAEDPSKYDEDANLFEGAEAISDENGKLVFEGLAPGVYHLTEIEAPESYALDKTVHTLEIRVDESDFNDKKELTSVTYIFDKNETSGTTALAAVYNIKNTKMTELPSTGGAGTAIMLIVGIGGAIAGFLVLAATRKKDEDK